MWEKYYLLDFSVLMNDGGDPSEKHTMRKEMEALLDRERLLKYRRKKNEKGALQSLGAGLLLQLALREYEEFQAERKRPDQERREGREEQAAEAGLLWVNVLWQLTPQMVLERLKGKAPVEVVYGYGADGKPFFRNLPLCFSLSHSGEAVFLAVSEREIGADIQIAAGTDWKALARRFYGRADIERIEKCGSGGNPGGAPADEAKKKAMFYLLWTRKEAFGKLTGEGVSKYLDRELPGEDQGISWNGGKRTIGEKDYFLAVCRRERSVETEREEQRV